MIKSEQDHCQEVELLPFKQLQLKQGNIILAFCFWFFKPITASATKP